MSSTIKDIAKDTGLSLATISKYLNHKKISDKNRVLIEESIRRRNYMPNSNAQALRSKSSHCICIFMPDIQDYHFGQECDCIMKAMREKGYSTIIRSYTEGPGLEENDISFLENRQIDGVILFAKVSFPPLLINYLRSHEIPFVCMHQKSSLPVDFVGCEDPASGRLAAQYLLERGHRRILLLGLDSYSSTQKIEGFLAVYQQKHETSSDLSIVLFPPSELSESRSLAVPRENHPTAVLFLDHFTSLPLIGSFLGSSHSKEAPYSLMAFDDDEVFSAIVPAVTALAQDVERLGAEAADLLYRRICGDFSDFPQSKLVSVQLLERESVF